MSLAPRLDLRQSQSLVMTPQLQQAIRLLALSNLEVETFIAEEIERNPLLDSSSAGSDDDGPIVEREAPAAMGDEPASADALLNGESGGEASLDVDFAAESFHHDSPSDQAGMDGSLGLNGGMSGGASEDGPDLDAFADTSLSLADHLLQQAGEVLSGADMFVAQHLIDLIDDAGYLTTPLLDIANRLGVPLVHVEDVLKVIQTFDPTGVGARSLAECMLIQAMACGQDDDLVVKMIRSHLGNLEKKNYQAIARDLKQPLEEIYEAAKVIMDFDPRPGRQYSSDDPHYVTPDVYIHKVGDKYFVVPNDDGLPKLKISGFYKNAMGNSAASKDYVQDKLRSAQWLIRSIQQRQRTIIKVAESILKFQRDFFDKGIAHLKPLILRDVAEDIGMHESTVSRVTTAKYVHTPQGIFELKYFFNSSIARTGGDDIASEAVKNHIKQLVSTENAKNPYSDQKIVELLKAQGIEIARRTVAKYREVLGVLPSSKRKKYY
jgi:RNA polymerase sigma-54 factor